MSPPAPICMSGWMFLVDVYFIYIYIYHFFWYQPTRVVPDKVPLNSCVGACVCMCMKSAAKSLALALSQTVVLSLLSSALATNTDLICALQTLPYHSHIFCQKFFIY